MDKMINEIINPSFEYGTYGWEPQSAYTGKISTVPTPPEMESSLTSGGNVLKVTTAGADVRVNQAKFARIPVTQGQVVQASVTIYSPDREAFFSIYSGNDGSSGSGRQSTKVPAGETRRVTVSTVVPAGHTKGFVELRASPGSGSAGDVIYYDCVTTVSDAEFFDGDTPDTPAPGSNSDFFRHSWVGEPGKSASVRELVRSATDWTRRWWGILPTSYKELDAIQNESSGGFPLLKFMDGPGHIAGGVRDLSDLMWSGGFTDPETVPDYAIQWLAQMLGVPAAQRELPVETLREYLVDLVTQGRPAAGNRQSIVLAAKRFLTGGRQTLVQPSAKDAHTILVLVREDEVPGLNTQIIVDGIRAAGVVPAGHDLKVVLANSTWDTWEAASGVSWDELEALAPTWARADSLGIVLE